MAIINLVEPINQRYKIRINFTSGRFATSAYGNAIKLTLVDEQNLALYRNIFELTYSSAWNATRGNDERRDGRQKKSWKSFSSEKALRFMRPNFIDQCCEVMGEQYRNEIKLAMRRLGTKVRAGRFPR